MPADLVFVAGKGVRDAGSEDPCTQRPAYPSSSWASFVSPDGTLIGQKYLRPRPSLRQDDCSFLQQQQQQQQEEEKRCESGNLSIFDHFMSQSCSQHGQRNSHSRVGLQNKHQLSPESGVRLRNEESRGRVGEEYWTGSWMGDGRRNGIRKIRDDCQRIINRSVFSKVQRDGLEAAFCETKYITKQQRLLLAHQLKLKDFQVKIWFQNRRSKWRNSDNFRNEVVQYCSQPHASRP